VAYNAYEVVQKAPTASSRQATVVVQLPEDARLYVDGQLANLTSTTRSFLTPELEPGRQYYYTIKAEADRGGRPLAQEKRIVVEAGKVARVQLNDLGATPTVAVDRSSAEVIVKLPSDARLFVDGQLCPLASDTRTFQTPPLEAGKQYFWTLKAEVVRDGRTHAESRRLDLMAGTRVTVDFNDLTATQAVQR
jgi:uncharacterized protein (TIGR03000 family)